jgi:Gram-negative bacterial TonB protein C-terminal
MQKIYDGSMIPKLLTCSLIFSLLLHSATAQKIRYYDAHNNEVRYDEAYYFTVQYKMNDTCWEKDYYHAKGPLIKKEQYKDQKNTVKNGEYFFYNKIGLIDSSGVFLNDKQEGIWIVYDGSGDPSLQELYQRGALVETKDLSPVKENDSVADAMDTLTKSQHTESSFPGGQDGWIKYISRNLKTPDDVISNNSNFTGRVIVAFTIDKDGTIHDILLVKSMLYLMDDLYLKLIKTSPRWVPATESGVAIRSYKKQPFNFRIQ